MDLSFLVKGHVGQSVFLSQEVGQSNVRDRNLEEAVVVLFRHPLFHGS